MSDDATIAQTKRDENWRGKVGGMSADEVNEFLAGGTLGRLAVLDEQGWPYVVPIWFEWEPHGGAFWIIARKRSAWAEFLRRDPRVALTIDGNAPPYYKVAVQGIADVVEEPNVGGKWEAIAKRMAIRYLGERGHEYIARTIERPRWLFRVTPESFLTWQGVAWHQRYKT